MPRARQANPSTRWKFPTRLGALVTAFVALAFAPLSAMAQEHPFPFHAVHYDVQATVGAAEQTLAAQATVEMVADDVSRTAVVELHPDLNISLVTQNGSPLTYQRDPNNALRVRITLPLAYAPGQHLTFTMAYTGPVSGEDDSPTRGLRLASIDKRGAILLLASRWFPLTNFPANRFTGTFRITAPQEFAVVGTGISAPPTMIAGGQVAYTFQCNEPGPVGTFVAGPLQLTPVAAQGISISVYAPAGAPSADLYGTTLAKIMTDMTAQFGPLPSTGMTIAQMADGSVGDYSAPGLLLISARHWSEKVDDEILVRNAALQWWGSAVMPASASDVWLSDGLSYYSEAMYIQQNEGDQAERNVLRKFAVGTLMYEDVAPIAQAQQLAYDSPQYSSIVENKGAMVFHMLRTALGEDHFTQLLDAYYRQYRGKNASLADFEKLAAQYQPPASGSAPTVNLDSFFSQWINSTGIPEFTLDYTVYRTARGFKTVGKATQSLEAFNMPVEIRVDTEGNPETEIINITGLTSRFEIDTFGRPKPNGVVLDPNNNMLRSSPRLRVMAAVARGENEAEQGRYYEAIQDYQQALGLQANNSLALFRMGEAMFYQKNYQAAANAFRDSLDGDLDSSYRWVEVWSHIYLGQIFDVTGQRERAVNEYVRAQHLKDDTGQAQETVAKYLAKPYGSTATSGAGTSATGAPPAGTTSATSPPNTSPASTSGGTPTTAPSNVPVLKRP
jgi:tetratricopeptide (TPR) repeat protein